MHSTNKSGRWVYSLGNDPKLEVITELILLGYDRFNKAELLESHIHENGYELVYIEHGAVNWEVDGTTYHTHAQQIFHTRPGERHRASFNFIGPSTIWWIIIRDPATHPGWFSLDEQERTEFKHILTNLPRISTIGSRISEPFCCLRQLIEDQETMLLEYRIRHYVLEILLRLMQSTPKLQRSSDIYEFAMNLTARIEEDPALRLSNEQLAVEAGLSESHFYRVFRESIGQSPAAYIERVRMDCACRMLDQSSTSITDIALDLGFKTSQHFATVFKKYIGMSPRAWRTGERS